MQRHWQALARSSACMSACLVPISVCPDKLALPVCGNPTVKVWTLYRSSSEQQQGSQHLAGPQRQEDSFTEDRIRMQQGGETDLRVMADAAVQH